MKRLLKMTGVLAVAAMLTLTGCAGPRDSAADKSINVDVQQFWREALQKYRTDDSVGQLLVVRYLGGCDAKVLFYEKDRSDNDVWSLAFETEGYVGKNGIGKTGEGDAKTPTGDFAVQEAFGIREDPGTELPYIQVKETTYACDEDCEYYNQIIDTEETGHECGGEEMYKYSPEYNYGLTTDYNAENVYPNGSSIFIHCIGMKHFTGGCVALPEDYMRLVVQAAEPGMRVIINYD